MKDEAKIKRKTLSVGKMNDAAEIISLLLPMEKCILSFLNHFFSRHNDIARKNSVEDEYTISSAILPLCN